MDFIVGIDAAVSLKRPKDGTFCETARRENRNKILRI